MSCRSCHPTTSPHNNSTTIHQLSTSFLKYAHAKQPHIPVCQWCQHCHDMTFWTFLALYSPVLFIILGLIPFLFAYFHTSDISKAKPEGIHWEWTTKKDHLLFMSFWHLPPVNDVAAVSQLLHSIGLAPVHHNLQAG